MSVARAKDIRVGQRIRVWSDEGPVRRILYGTRDGGRAGPFQVVVLEMECRHYSGSVMTGKRGHYWNGSAGPRYEFMPDEQVEVVDD